MTIEIITIVLLSLISILLAYKGGQIVRTLIAGYGIPNVASDQDTIRTLLDIINLKDDDLFVDLGAGEGVVVSLISQYHPETTCIGYEGSPKTHRLAQAKKEKNKGNYHIYHENFFKVDLSTATHIYCYLMPHLMGRVRNKIRRECKPGTKLFVNSFPIPGKTEQTKIANIYIYTV